MTEFWAFSAGSMLSCILTSVALWRVSERTLKSEVARARREERWKMLEGFAERMNATEIERERLRGRLRWFDECQCGEQRKNHAEGLPIRCTGFRLKETADDLETIVALASGDTKAISDLHNMDVVASREDKCECGPDCVCGACSGEVIDASYIADGRLIE